MITIFDNLNALIVAGTVLLILFALKLRTTEVEVEQTATYIVKKQGGDLATWLEDDLLTLGLNIDKTSEVPFESPIDSAEVTTEFTFYSDSVDTNTGNVIRISRRYELDQAGTRYIDGNDVNVFELRRFEKIGTGAWNQDGQSPTLLTYFKIDLLNMDAQPVTNGKALAASNPDTVRNTRVRFTLLTPFETQRTTLRKVYYGSTLMIPN